MHAVFLSPISREWDTNVTTFSVVFVQKLLYNAEKNSVKIKEEKTDWKQKEDGQSKTIKLKKNIRSCFRWVRIWLNDSRKRKKDSEKTQKTVKKCKKTTKTKLILSWKYLNCHRNRNSLTFHRRNAKNIFHTFSKQKHNSSTKRWDCSTFLLKILRHTQQTSWKLFFVPVLPFFKAFLKL